MENTLFSTLKVSVVPSAFALHIMTALLALLLVLGQQLVGSRGQDLHRGMGRQPWQTPSKWGTSASLHCPTLGQFS